MMYRIGLQARAQKELDRLPSKEKQRVEQAIETLAVTPFIGKKLSGEFRGFWSYRVWPYRILYELRKKELFVFVITIAHRQRVYKK